MSKVETHEPDPDSREPARAVGALAAAGGLVVVLLARWLDVDPDVLAGVVAVLTPVVATELARRRVFAPATVARLLAAKRGEGL